MNDTYREPIYNLKSVARETGVKPDTLRAWERRYQLMRTHTALHVLCGVVWRDYRASVTGGNMQPLKGRMDFEFETMRKELVAEIERRLDETSFAVEAHGALEKVEQQLAELGYDADAHRQVQAELEAGKVVGVAPAMVAPGR